MVAFVSVSLAAFVCRLFLSLLRDVPSGTHDLHVIKFRFVLDV